MRGMRGTMLLVSFSSLVIFGLPLLIYSSTILGLLGQIEVLDPYAAKMLGGLNLALAYGCWEAFRRPEKNTVMVPVALIAQLSLALCSLYFLFVDILPGTTWFHVAIPAVLAILTARHLPLQEHVITMRAKR
ncbi:MAG TPA: hypothetical protein GXZ96_05280 [Firmicutes bacterium]|nr:hypothetical protein [Bacillota bacterium]